MAEKNNKALPALAETLADARSEYDSQAQTKWARDREKNQKFVELYLERSADFTFDNYGQMLRSCYQDAGWVLYTSGMYDARQCLARNWPAIEEALRQRMSGAAPMAIHTLIKLCTDAKQEAVRLKAATELLNKGGFAEVQKVQISNAEELSDDELQKQIQEQMAAHGLKVIQA